MSHSAAAMKSSNTFCLLRFVPGLAIFATAPKVRYGVDSAVFDPLDRRNGEGRCHRDIEATVAIQNGRVRSVLGQTFLVNEEHRHARAVLAVIEDLARIVRGRVE